MTNDSKDTSLDDSLNELLRELNAVPEQPVPTTTSSSSPVTPTTVSPQPSNNALYKLSSFPTEMSCTDAFNDLVACYSVGGQMRHIYRYGGISYCHEPWKKLKFCLRMKTSVTTSPEDEAKKVAFYYMEKLAKQKKEGGSSEDIWKVRTVPIKNPFQGGNNNGSE
ncbi:hypothetical protein D0Z03_002423 [Geotrichum reessii]|nr:hypothetical protein D0Z03_002423 [Galactomyces reessii]